MSRGMVGSNWEDPFIFKGERFEGVKVCLFFFVIVVLLLHY